MMQAYLSARQDAGFEASTARVLGMYHVYVGENSWEARAAAEQALAEYHAAAGQARSLTQGMPDPDSYRSDERHRAQMGSSSLTIWSTKAACSLVARGKYAKRWNTSASVST